MKILRLAAIMDIFSAMIILALRISGFITDAQTADTMGKVAAIMAVSGLGLVAASFVINPQQKSSSQNRSTKQGPQF